MVSWILLLMGIHYGVGRHNFYVSDEDEILAEKYLFLTQPPYPWALAFAKMSIAWMLIRLRREERIWVTVMAATMVIAAGIGVSANSFQLSLCHPLWAVWDHSNPDAVCMDLHVARTSINVHAGLTITTDVILSLAPITFIVKMKQPLREKFVLAFVMGLGLVASAASITKTFMTKNYGIAGDTLRDSVGITIWSILEMQLAITASCIPTLRQLFERILRRLGLLGSTPYNHSLSYFRDGYMVQDDGGPHQHPDEHSHDLDTMRRSDNVERRRVPADTESLGSEMPIVAKPSRVHQGESGHGDGERGSIAGE
ncbi:hypothetical protein B0H67DRAFT_599025 [Lasiosphaeris hirsuta]|uniref:Rhodopsin domain-containing protein n=1 Tax=Lasiosphaeris hirsuta TaxID=260670 RepID=A0AA40B1V4_9PEZI|nr:hypothetical protein B0H67DRAFT_599025 [Lasiosphaeris hirsuta]